MKSLRKRFSMIIGIMLVLSLMMAGVTSAADTSKEVKIVGYLLGAAPAGMSDRRRFVDTTVVSPGSTAASRPSCLPSAHAPRTSVTDRRHPHGRKVTIRWHASC